MSKSDVDHEKEKVAQREEGLRRSRDEVDDKGDNDNNKSGNFVGEIGYALNNAFPEGIPSATKTHDVAASLGLPDLGPAVSEATDALDQTDQDEEESKALVAHARTAGPLRHATSKKIAELKSRMELFLAGSKRRDYEKEVQEKEGQLRNIAAAIRKHAVLEPLIELYHNIAWMTELTTQIKAGLKSENEVEAVQDAAMAIFTGLDDHGWIRRTTPEEDRKIRDYLAARKAFLAQKEACEKSGENPPNPPKAPMRWIFFVDKKDRRGWNFVVSAPLEQERELFDPLKTFAVEQNRVDSPQEEEKPWMSREEQEAARQNLINSMTLISIKELMDGQIGNCLLTVPEKTVEKDGKPPKTYKPGEMVVQAYKHETRRGPQIFLKPVEGTAGGRLWTITEKMLAGNLRASLWAIVHNFVPRFEGERDDRKREFMLRSLRTFTYSVREAILATGLFTENEEWNLVPATDDEETDEVSDATDAVAAGEEPIEVPDTSEESVETDSE